MADVVSVVKDLDVNLNHLAARAARSVDGAAQLGRPKRFAEAQVEETSVTRLHLNQGLLIVLCAALDPPLRLVYQRPSTGRG